jgi:hypothetical protein
MDMALPFAIVALLLGLLFTVLGAALMLAVVAGIGFLAYLTVLTVISKIRSLLTKRAK